MVPKHCLPFQNKCFSFLVAEIIFQKQMVCYGIKIMHDVCYINFVSIDRVCEILSFDTTSVAANFEKLKKAGYNVIVLGWGGDLIFRC